MKTSTIEVGELVSTLSAAGVHLQLSTLPGVHHADVCPHRRFRRDSRADGPAPPMATAVRSAQVVLMKSDPYDVVGAIELSSATLRKMHQNLWWAVGHNVIGFPVAAGVFNPFTLSPEIAALSMSGSSAVVAINALMLKRTKLAGIKRVASPRAPVTAAGVAAGASA